MAEADQRRRVKRPDAHPSVPLHHDQAVGGGVPDGHGAPGQDGQFLRAEGGGLVANPLLHIALGLHFVQRPHRPRLHETVRHEIRVQVQFPVNHVQQMLQIAPFGGRRVLPQQFLRHHGGACQGLVHRKHVRSSLGLVGAQAAGGVQDSRRHVPTRSDVQPVRFGEAGDLVVALVEVAQSLSHLVARGARFQAKEGVGKIRAVVVDLRGEVVRLRLAQLTGELGEMIVVVDVVRQRAFVVEEF